jgi:hypothetical protein
MRNNDSLAMDDFGGDLSKLERRAGKLSAEVTNQLDDLLRVKSPFVNLLAIFERCCKDRTIPPSDVTLIPRGMSGDAMA